MASVRILTVRGACRRGLHCCRLWARRPKGREATFRVCADPKQLAVFDERLEGFENKIVELIRQEFGATPTFTWWPDRAGFIRNTLRANQATS